MAELFNEPVGDFVWGPERRIDQLGIAAASMLRRWTVQLALVLLGAGLLAAAVTLA